MSVPPWSCCCWTSSTSSNSASPNLSTRSPPSRDSSPGPPCNPAPWRPRLPKHRHRLPSGPAPTSATRPPNSPSTAKRPFPSPPPPPAAPRHGYEDFIVPDLVSEARNTRYRRERWLLPDGTTVLAPLPGDLTPGSHFGPRLRAFIRHQYHGQRVT